MKSNAVEDVSKLTQVSDKVLNKIVDLLRTTIAETFSESEEIGDDTTSVDIGIGELTILHKNDELRFRFNPSAKLQEDIKKILSGDRDIFVEKVENSLSQKISDLYKELL